MNSVSQEVKTLIRHELATMVRNQEKIIYPELAKKYDVSPRVIRELYNQHFKCTSTFTRYELINLARLARQTRTPNGELYWNQIMKFFPDKTLTQVKNCYKHFIRNAAERSRTMPNE